MSGIVKSAGKVLGKVGGAVGKLLGIEAPEAPALPQAPDVKPLTDPNEVLRLQQAKNRNLQRRAGSLTSKNLLAPSDENIKTKSLLGE